MSLLAVLPAIPAGLMWLITAIFAAKEGVSIYDQLKPLLGEDTNEQSLMRLQQEFQAAESEKQREAAKSLRGEEQRAQKATRDVALATQENNVMNTIRDQLAAKSTNSLRSAVSSTAPSGVNVGAALGLSL